MTTTDLEFARLLDTIVQSGEEVHTRNSTVLRYPVLSAEFTATPLVAVRRTAWKQALLEMEWFLSGSNSLLDLDPKVHHWWKPWADETGRIANNYSTQLRSFAGRDLIVDQVQLLIDGIRNHPLSRRNVITTWNTADMVSPETPITNCHGTVIQAFCSPNGCLDLVMYQRSADMVVGIPHNWIQYWALLMWLAHRTGKQARKFSWIGGDCHIYAEHLSLAERIITTPLNEPTPELVYTPTDDDFKAADFSLSCEYRPVIKESAALIV